MKPIHTLPLLALATGILTGCADAELDDYPHASVTLEASFIDGCPHYEIKAEASDGLQIDNVTLVQFYHDNNTTPLLSDDKREVFQLHLSADNTCSYTDRTKLPYAQDAFTAIAYIHTELGYSRSETVTLVVPGSGDVIITSATFDFDQPTGRTGTVRIYGGTFTDNTEQISIANLDDGFNTRSAKRRCYRDSLIFSNVECLQYGSHKLELRHYGKRIPFEVRTEGLSIDDVSPRTIKVGEPLTVRYSNVAEESDFSIKIDQRLAYSILTLTQDEHEATILLHFDNAWNFTSIERRVVLTDNIRKIDAVSDIVTITRDAWNSGEATIENNRCLVGNRVISNAGRMIYGYNLDTQTPDISQLVTFEVPMVNGQKLLSVDNRYAYVWYWRTGGNGYLARFDTEQLTWEPVTTLKTACTMPWFEDEHTFRAMLGFTLFTYHLDTDTWDDPIETKAGRDGLMLNSQCKILGLYDGYVYFFRTDTIYRYPKGDPQSVERVARPASLFSYPYTIHDGYLYYAYFDGTNRYNRNCYIYRTSVQSLIEGTDRRECIGCPDGPFETDQSDFLVSDDYYVFISDKQLRYLTK